MANRIKGKGVEIAGLDDLRKDLRRIVREGGTDGLSLLKAANIRVAEHIRTRAVTRAGGVGPQQLRAALSMKSTKRADRASITGGNARVPWFSGAEFGAGLWQRNDIGGRARPNPGIGWSQFRKGNGEHLTWNAPGQGKTGYFLFPTMRAESETIKEMYGHELDKILAIAFPEGR